MRPGTSLLVFLVACLYIAAYSRMFLHDGGPPAFFLEKQEGVRVLLDKGFPEMGVRQFGDDSTLVDVIKLTELKVSSKLLETLPTHPPLISGESLALRMQGARIVAVERGWMHASQRMALGIPLHPDRMTLQDWQALPGVGPKLAARIEEDRQINGEFGSLEELGRVKGVGQARLEAWRLFF